MKALNIFLILALVFLLGQMFTVQAAETNYNEVVNKAEHHGGLVYYGTVTFADSGNGDAYYTQKMKISASNYADGYARFICSEVGTEDVNIYTEISHDGTTWIALDTDADLDAVGTTAVVDTIGLEQGTDQLLYHASPYLRFKMEAGQAMNSTIVTWNYWMSKNAGVEFKAVGGTSDTPES